VLGRRLSLLGVFLAVSAVILACGAFVLGTFLTQIAADRRVVWGVTIAVFLALWVALALLVRGTSRTLDRQTRLLHERSTALADAHGTLERRSREAIESLNATVEARDPSAAGLSGRVQRLALALGSHLGLRGAELDSLAHGALLHDIGNIAVPDALLAKAGELTHHEYEQVKLHADEGAAIVARLSPLHDAVPIVLHHHERWDGQGYPDGLAGSEIPVAAAIVSVAASWEAMTRSRPFRWGLDPEEAVGELVRGRGTQFAPAVVDAFLAAVRIRSSEVWAPGGSARRLVAVEMLSDR
jgi:HD-GYP domain-containing protein (c-di-GMP phosphodiesterase class II)